LLRTLLQLLQLLAYRRLRQEHPLGASRDAAGLGDRDEGAQLAQIESTPAHDSESPMEVI
jgi:hypothetical protein